MLLLNGNLKEENLGFKKLHLNRKGNNALAKNLLSFIERNWFLNLLGNTFNEMVIVFNTATVVVSDAKKTLKIVRISNINRLIFGHLNINS